MTDKAPPTPEVIYQIVDWDQHFENNKSRERDACSWCPIPNKQDGLSYGRLLRMPNGPALYGAFVAVCLVVSKQRRARDGHLTDTGRPDGAPHDAESLSIKTQMPQETISAMLEACTSAKIGWIRRYERVPAECPPSARTVPTQGREGKGIEGKEEKRMPASATPPKTGSDSKPDQKPTARYKPLEPTATIPEMVEHLRQNHPEFRNVPQVAIEASFASVRGQKTKAEMVQAVNALIRHYAGDAPLGMPAPRRLENYLRADVKKTTDPEAKKITVPAGKPGVYEAGMEFVPTQPI